MTKNLSPSTLSLSFSLSLTHTHTHWCTHAHSYIRHIFIHALVSTAIHLLFLMTISPESVGLQLRPSPHTHIRGIVSGFAERERERERESVEGDKFFVIFSYMTNFQRFILECGSKCTCGNRCVTRVVQRGSTVPLQVSIFPSLSLSFSLSRTQAYSLLFQDMVQLTTL